MADYPDDWFVPTTLEDFTFPLTNDEACEQAKVSVVQVLDGTGNVFNFPPGELDYVGGVGHYTSFSVRDLPSETLVAELKRRRDEGQKIAELIRGAELGEIR